MLTVANLPTVPFHLADLSITENVILCSSCRLEFLSIVIELVEELLPDLSTVVSRKVVVADDHMDAGDEGIVEVSHAVGRQEQNAAVVFDAAQEY